ncbi:hypothetical protein [Phaeobacter sp. HF9A]|nr:hypothetical protein [Phaeobacter sp. HF9A]NIZ13092.1 hypothetical protein [Phaeobacter sp. HF9A]
MINACADDVVEQIKAATNGGVNDALGTTGLPPVIRQSITPILRMI